MGAEDDSITASNQYKHARSYSAALDFLLFFYLQLVPWSRLQNFHQRLLQNRALRLEKNYFIELFFLKNFIWGPLSKIINKNQ